VLGERMRHLGSGRHRGDPQVIVAQVIGHQFAHGRIVVDGEDVVLHSAAHGFAAGQHKLARGPQGEQAVPSVYSCNRRNPLETAGDKIMACRDLQPVDRLRPMSSIVIIEDDDS